MDRQEIFDTVARHLLTQKVPATDHLGICQYLADDGKKCAVGCLITAEEYHPKMEGHGVKELLRKFELARFAPFIELLESLQAVHDDRDPSEWPEALALIASDFRLSPAVLKEFEE